MIEVKERQGDRMTLRASGTLERRDYELVMPQLEDAIAHHGKLRMLIELEDFHGWRPAALVDELRFDIRHRKDISRCAVVGEKGAERWLTRLTAPLFEGEVRFFPREEIALARRWLDAGEAAEEPIPPAS